MEIYMGIKREEGIVLKGITVYDESGVEIHRATKQYREESPRKFDATIRSMTWGLRQFRKLEEQGVIDVKEKVKIYTEGKTVYGWIKKGESSKAYTIAFSELMLELSLMSVETEIHLIEGHRVRFREPEEEMSRVMDILAEFDVEE